MGVISRIADAVRTAIGQQQASIDDDYRVLVVLAAAAEHSGDPSSFDAESAAAFLQENGFSSEDFATAVTAQVKRLADADLAKTYATAAKNRQAVRTRLIAAEEAFKTAKLKFTEGLPSMISALIAETKAEAAATQVNVHLG
jgi:hypothetical protein